MSTSISPTVARSLLGRIRHEVIERDLARVSPSHRALVLPFRVGLLALSGAQRHQILIYAAALTYISIVSLVPTLAVALAMFKAFGGLERARRVLMPRLLDNLAVGAGAMVESTVAEFIDHIHGGAIGSVGIVVLLLVVVFLLSGIENAFNQIFEMPRPRKLLHRVAGYWTLVTVAPTALLIGVTLPATVRRLAPGLWETVRATPIGVLISLVVPLVLVTLGFALLYYFIPNAYVTARAAAIGALVAGLLWWAAVHGYAYYAGLLVTYSRIYGSLGVVPIFLLWVWLTWLIVLLGAEVAAAVQYAPTAPLTDARKRVSQRLRELLALRVMAAVAHRYEAGEAPATIDDICLETQAPSRLTVEVVGHLCESGLLAESTDGRLLPSSDPKRLAPADVQRALRRHGDDSVWEAHDATTEALARWQDEHDDDTAKASSARTTLLDVSTPPTGAR